MNNHTTSNTNKKAKSIHVLFLVQNGGVLFGYLATALQEQAI